MKKVSYHQRKSDAKLILVLALLIFLLLYFIGSFFLLMLKKYRQGQLSLGRWILFLTFALVFLSLMLCLSFLLYQFALYLRNSYS